MEASKSRNGENTSERVIRQLVYAPGMPVTYHFTRRDEQSRHNSAFATDGSTGGLVMATPNGTGHEDARLYGGGEAPHSRYFFCNPAFYGLGYPIDVN